MKNYFLPLLIVLIFALPALSQVKDEIDGKTRVVPYDKIDATFGLDTATTVQDVGFDSPKSSWKFSYELRFLPDSNVTYEVQKRVHAKYGIKPNQMETSKIHQEVRDEIRKLAHPFAKGKIKRVALEPEDNRLIIIPVNLTPEIQQALGDASLTKQDPEFIVTVKGKVSTKTASKIRFKNKYTEQFECPVKIRSTNGKTYWSLNRCGVLIEAAQDKGRIYLDRTIKL